LSKIKILLSNNFGYKWFSNNNIYVKGYIYDKYGNYFGGRNLINYFNNIKNIDDFKNLLINSNGFYSVIIESKSNLFFASDRLRSFPLFYLLDRGIIYLSDSGLQLLEVLNDLKVDRLMKLEYLNSGFVLGEDTILKPIKQLEAGIFIVFNKKNRNISKINYFELKHNDTFKLKTSSFLTTNLDEVFNDVFKRLLNFINDRQIVIPLSSGFDSRIILQKLIELGYKNIITFSYGKKNNKESLISQNIAKYFNVSWYFIEYNNKVWQNVFKDKNFLDFNQFAFNISSYVHVQDFPAIQYLIDKKIIERESVVIPGHSGDFIAGSHIPLKYSGKVFITLNQLCKDISKKHFISKERIKAKYFRGINNSKLINIKTASSKFECIDMKERQAKLIVNSVRVYEYFGLKWCLPLWDNKIIEFWMKVPLKKRLGRELYYNYALNYYSYIDTDIKFIRKQYFLRKIYSLKLGFLIKYYEKFKKKILRTKASNNDVMQWSITKNNRINNIGIFINHLTINIFSKKFIN